MSFSVTFKGKPLTLVGRRLKKDTSAPDFRVVSGALKEAGLPDFKGKIKVINFFPSLDTPVCDLQVKEFNKSSTGLSSEIVMLGISKDLPFAQERFCQMNEIKNEVVFSDYKYSSFGINYGVLIKELNLLARGVAIIDKDDMLRYLQIVPEITQAVNFQEALAALKEATNNPKIIFPEELPSRCKPCEGGIPALAKDKIEKLLAAHRLWQLVEGKSLVKELKFKDFVEAKYFLDLISVIAEGQGHHPSLEIAYNKLKVTLTTHASGGLTENDFIMAKLIDELGV